MRLLCGRVLHQKQQQLNKKKVVAQRSHAQVRLRCPCWQSMLCPHLSLKRLHCHLQLLQRLLPRECWKGHNWHQKRRIFYQKLLQWAMRVWCGVHLVLSRPHHWDCLPRGQPQSIQQLLQQVRVRFQKLLWHRQWRLLPLLLQPNPRVFLQGLRLLREQLVFHCQFQMLLLLQLRLRVQRGRLLWQMQRLRQSEH